VQTGEEMGTRKKGKEWGRSGEGSLWDLDEGFSAAISSYRVTLVSFECCSSADTRSVHGQKRASRGPQKQLDWKAFQETKKAGGREGGSRETARETGKVPHLDADCGGDQSGGSASEERCWSEARKHFVEQETADSEKPTF
jgi:hypothetical protein